VSLAKGLQAQTGAADARRVTQNTGATATSDGASGQVSTTPSAADIAETDRAIRTARLHATGSWLVVLAVILGTQRSNGRFVEAAVCVLFAIGGWVALELLRGNVMRKVADPITGQSNLPGGPLPLAAKTKIAFALQALAAVGVLILLDG